MKILWVKSDFLHPTTKGGQIRTLEMLRRLNRDHEVHYVAFANSSDSEGVTKSSQYCRRAYPIQLNVPDHSSPRFYMQLARGLFSRVPVAVARYRSTAMEKMIASIRQSNDFGALVCDFLVPSVNIPDMQNFVLFQHNVETTIWERHVEHARDSLRRAYLRLQANRMRDYEREICARALHTIAVSSVDAALMRKRFGISKISEVATGVDIDYFQPSAERVDPVADLVFIGSMDWLPNIQGVRWFVDEVFPLILQKRPSCTVAIVGRKPTPEIVELAGRFPGIQVTGTVPDVRPFLWGAAASIVPIHIGGGTRLKIYESMAAKVPVVSTSVGAEGLVVENGGNILIADTAAEFADRCLDLIENPSLSRSIREAAWNMVASRFSWDYIAREFASILGACACE